MRELKTFYIKSYGCQMNELDSSLMAGLLKERGLTQVKDENEADLLLFNTCSVRELAEQKVIVKVGLMGRKKRPNRVVGITGCMASAKKGTLLKKIPSVDFILGPNNIHDLNVALDLVLQGKPKQAFVDQKFSQELDFTKAHREDRLRAYVSIIRGCNKFCTYCVVPYTRGPEVSRDPASIIEECKRLFEQGYKEIQLLGQNVNSYGKDHPEWGVRFSDLLYQLDKLGDKKWVRFLTSHPVDITDDLIDAMASLESLVEHLHFPLQAGSNRILQKMHRIYTREEYLEKVQRVKEKIPEIALGTDMIVGFPTETEEEFQESLTAMRQVKYHHAFLYTYSPRKNTPAIRFADDVTKEDKAKRHAEIFRLHNEISGQLRQEMLGCEVEILVERKNRDSHHLKGVTRSWHNVIFDGNDSLIGTFQKVKLTSFSHETFIGSLIHQQL